MPTLDWLVRGAAFRVAEAVTKREAPTAPRTAPVTL